jgi:hypothetical protein
MNCANHTDTPAIAYCRQCGKPLCAACERPVESTIYCQEHAPMAAPFAPAAAAPAYTSSPYTAPAEPIMTQPAYVDSGASPGLAFLLGLIPGVGAIYNGQYVKGLIHVVVLGVLISIVSSEASGGFEPLFAMLIGVWVFYMAFEAYHTAKRRQLGERVDEFSSIFPLRGRSSNFPVGPLALIALGLIFLLNTMGWINMAQMIRYWPIALIALGLYMLYERFWPSEPHAPIASEASHERR